MMSNDDPSGAPALLDVAGVNPGDRELTAQCLELVQVFSGLKSREDRRAVLGYAKRLQGFAAQRSEGRSA